MSGLRELLKRVETATGPDRALDLALATALAPDVLVLRQRQDDSGADPYTYWEYTGSIDAALALVAKVLPSLVLEIKWPPITAYDNTRHCYVTWWSRDINNGASQFVHPATAPLAILAALLRAHQEGR